MCSRKFFQSYLEKLTTILSQVLFEKYLQNVVTTDSIEKFFSKVIFELASRAARNELPYTYQELITKWDVSYKGQDSSSQDSTQAFDKRVMDVVKRSGYSTPTKGLPLPRSRGCSPCGALCITPVLAAPTHQEPVVDVQTKLGLSSSMGAVSERLVGACATVLCTTG